MPEDEKQSGQEEAYEQGFRMATLRMMGTCRHMLGTDDAESKLAFLLEERELARVALKELCKEFGDADYPDNLYLPDVIEKRLGRSLYAARDERGG